MNWKLFLSQFFLPASLQKEYLARLFDIAAEAFGAGKKHFPPTADMEGMLWEFAVITRTHAEQIVRDTDRSAAARRVLFEGAHALGIRLRSELAVKTHRDACIAARTVYRALKIDFSCDPAGNVIIRKCFFSRFYSADACALISALDQGLIAGLTGGMQMAFSGRITQNNPCCTARISP